MLSTSNILQAWQRKSGIGVAAQGRRIRCVSRPGNRTKQNEQNDKPGGKQNDVPNPAMAQASRTESEDLRAEVTARHRQEWKQVAILRQEALAVRVSNPDQAMVKAKLAKIVAETTAIQQAGERKAWGLDILVDPGALKDLTDQQLEDIINGKVAG